MMSGSDGPQPSKKKKKQGFLTSTIDECRAKAERNCSGSDFQVICRYIL